MRTKATILFLTMFMTILSANAQTGLRINDLFEGKIIGKERIVETRVRGKTLQPYRLTFYRSLRFSATADEAQHLRQTAEADTHESVSNVTTSKGTTLTIKLQATPTAEGLSRFLCYKDRKKSDSQHEIMVIYMEGHVESLDELDTLLEKTPAKRKTTLY